MELLSHFTIHAKPKVRHDQMEGKKYLVVPMVMMVEGVHNGNHGPLFYPSEELSTFPMAWNHKPVVVYHPEINGIGVSACSPDVLSSQKIGVIMNTRFENGKLHAEAWIEENRAAEVDDRVLEAIENGTMLELSTGLFSFHELKSGDWNGKTYDKIARSIRPDHLAVLPDQIGACSIKDGAGFLRLNEASHSDIHEALRLAVKEVFGTKEEIESTWVVDVYKKSFVYERNGKLFQRGYSVKDGKAMLEGEPVEVVRTIGYRTVNAEKSQKEIDSNERNEMNKEKLVSGLISNSASKWEESDREFLMGLEDGHLLKLAPVEPVSNAAVEEKPTILQNTASQARPLADLTVNEYIQAAPPAVREMLSSMAATHNAERGRLIKAITDNKKNIFTSEYLQTLDVQQLQGIAKLAAEEPVQNNRPAVFLDQATVSHNSEQEAPLEVPKWEF